MSLSEQNIITQNIIKILQDLIELDEKFKDILIQKKQITEQAYV